MLLWFTSVSVQAGQILTLRHLLWLLCLITSHDQEGREIIESRLQNGKLKNYTGEERFRVQEYHRLRHWVIPPIVSNHCFGGCCGPQPGSLTARASPLVKAIINFPHTIGWPPRTIS